MGANQDGRTDPITLRHKDDAKGIGFQGHADTWLVHQDDFQVRGMFLKKNIVNGETQLIIKFFQVVLSDFIF